MTKTKAKTARVPKTAGAAPRTSPGLKRLRKAPTAEAIRLSVLADQENGRAEALARIEAEKAEAAIAALPEAPQTPTDAAAPANAADAESPPAPAAAKAEARFARGAAVPPTDVPTPAPKMPGISAKNADLYMRAATGEMPTPPDFSPASYAPDRKRLAELVKLAEVGDAAGLRAFAIKTYYSAALQMDRFRHRCIIALEARARQAAAA